MQFGLPDDTIGKIQKVFESNSKIDEVIIFGSRAKGNYKEGSDIDFAVKGRNINFDDILKLIGQLDELNLPYKIDLLDYNNITEKDLVEHMDRVGIVIYESWKSYRVNDFAKIHDSKRIPLSFLEREKRQGIYPYYGASGIVDYIDDYIFDGDYVLISEDGENLNSRQTPIAFEASGKFWVNNHAHILKGKKAFHNKLLVNYFAQLDLTPFITGAVQPKLSKENLLSIPIYLPKNENEQISIISILTSLNDKIDLLERQNKTLEQLSETLFRQWFVEEAEESWGKGKLGDVIDLIYGKALKEEIRTGIGFPVVGSSGIVGYHEEYLVEGPGIIIGRKGTLGKVIYLVENFSPIDTTYYVRSNVNSAGLFYEYFLLKTLNFEEMNSDSAVPGLNRDIALSTEIRIAPIDKLKKFNQYSSVYFEKLNQNIKQIKTLTQLKDALLPRLMRGEVRVEMN